MCDLQLRKGGKLITIEWDFETNNFEEREIPSNELIFYLQDSICFNNDVNLRDIFMLMERDIQSFSAVVGCPFLTELINESLNNSDTCNDGICSLQLQRVIFLEGSELKFDFDFYGVGEEEYYSLEFISISQLSLYPIFLNTSIIMMNQEEQEINSGLTQEFSLFEVLNGIINELSFVGTPNMREFTLDHLQNKYDGYENSWQYRQCIVEDFEKKLEDDKKNNSIICKLCGEDARSKCFGKPIDICGKCFKTIKEN